jgi:putative peptide zinc metalloprotease protein
MRKVKKARAAGFGVAFVAIVAGVLLIPTPLRVQGTLVLTAAKPEEVYAEVPGRLVELKVRDGQWVTKGTELAILSNPEKARERIQREEQHDINFIKHLWYARIDSHDSRAQARVHDQMATDQQKEINKVIEQIGKLRLVAGRDGQVMGVPHPETTGQWLKPGGKPFCEIGDPKRLEAHLILDQSDVDLVKLDDSSSPTVWLKIYGNSTVTRRSYVKYVAKKNREEIPPELSNLAGGEIATKPDQKTGTAKPLSAVYEVIIPLRNDDLNIQVNSRGFAKIDAGHCTLGWWLWRAVTKTFHFNI